MRARRGGAVHAVVPLETAASSSHRIAVHRRVSAIFL